MSGLPELTMTGTLTADPEIRYIASGDAVATFTVACNSRRRNTDTGEWEDASTTFLRCQVWREHAEHVSESLSKATRVIVTGRLKQRSYDKTGADGTPVTDSEGNPVRRTVFDVDVDEVGPALRWSTATVRKATRSSTNGGGTAIPSPSPAAEDVWTKPTEAANTNDAPPF